MKIILKKPLITIGKMLVVLAVKMNTSGIWPLTSSMVIPANLQSRVLLSPAQLKQVRPKRLRLLLKNNREF